MESTRKTVKDSSFFFFVRSTAAEGSSQQSTAAVIRADVALTSLGLTWQQRRNACEARGGAGRRVGAHARVAGETESSGGACGRVQV